MLGIYQISQAKRNITLNYPQEICYENRNLGTSLLSSHPIHEEAHTATGIIHIFFMALNIQAEVFTHSACTLPALLTIGYLSTEWLRVLYKNNLSVYLLDKKKRKRDREREDLLALYRDGRWKVGDPTPWTSVILKIIPPPGKYRCMHIFFSFRWGWSLLAFPKPNSLCIILILDFVYFFCF